MKVRRRVGWPQPDNVPRVTTAANETATKNHRSSDRLMSSTLWAVSQSGAKSQVGRYVLLRAEHLLTRWVAHT